MVYFTVLSWQPHRQNEPGLNRSCDKPQGWEWELIPLLLDQTRLTGCLLNYFVGLQNWEPIGCPKTSATNCQPYVALHPEKRRSQAHSSGNLQSHIAVSDVQKTNWQRPRDVAFLLVITTNLKNFYALLTVHPGTALGKWPTWCTITFYNTFIIIILYMFRATLCSSSGGQIVLLQQVEKILLNLHTGRSLTENTIPDAVLIQFDLLMMSTELLETCRGL